MSNPSINRWGLNLFWYRFWYNDKNNALIIHQDDLINKLILIYIHYGLLYPKNLFINKFFFNNYKFNYLSFNENFNLKYFRLVEYKNKVLNEQKSYKIRTKVKNLYFSKLWILRYQNWLIINFYCFQPITVKNYKKTTFKKNLNFYLPEKKNLNYKINRFKILLFLIINTTFFKNNYYKF